MGCTGSRDIHDNDDSSSFYWSGSSSESARNDISSFITSSEFFVPKFPSSRTTRMSELIYNRDKSLTLSQCLFATNSTYKSQDSFFNRTASVYSTPLTKISSQLYLGSFEDAKNESQLVELGITHIISLIGPKHLIKGIQHMHKPMSDYGRTNLCEVIEDIWPYVLDSQKAGNKLFLHCQSGQNRSATVMTSILMKLKGEQHKLFDVYNLIKSKRPLVQINELYAKQLLELERNLFGKTTMPYDWMKIHSYDMATGSVVFHGEEKTKKRLGRKNLKLQTRNRKKVELNVDFYSSELSSCSTSCSLGFVSGCN
jgi:atypical dual specificity phosphatase